jgi:GxxExxY protein
MNHQNINIQKTNKFKPIPIELDSIASKIVDCAYHVHQNLGPGLLESIYESCFCYELKKKNLRYKRQVEIPIIYDQMKLDEKLRLDVLVEDSIICELKAVLEMNTVFEAQILTYLKLSKKRLGFLINFNVSSIKNGIKRYIL